MFCNTDGEYSQKSATHATKIFPSALSSRYFCAAFCFHSFMVGRRLESILSFSRGQTTHMTLSGILKLLFALVEPSCLSIHSCLSFIVTSIRSTDSNTRVKWVGRFTNSIHLGMMLTLLRPPSRHSKCFDAAYFGDRYSLDLDSSAA